MSAGAAVEEGVGYGNQLGAHTWHRDSDCGNATKLRRRWTPPTPSARLNQSWIRSKQLKAGWDATKFQGAGPKALSETEAKAELCGRLTLAAMGDPASFSATQKEQYEPCAELAMEVSNAGLRASWRMRMRL